MVAHSPDVCFAPKSGQDDYDVGRAALVGPRKPLFLSLKLVAVTSGKRQRQNVPSEESSSRRELLHALEDNLRQFGRLFAQCCMLHDVAFNPITISL